MEQAKKSTKQLQDTISDKARDIWLAGLGVFSTVEEEGGRLFDKFIERGKELEKKGEELEKKAKQSVNSFASLDEITKYIEEKMNRAFEKIGVSSHNEVKDLSKKVENLTNTIDSLSKKINNLS
jgi:poly(hydroxyalkanoate) granule-associated protein